MFDLDSATLSRMLTALTLGYHAIFATLGVGIPVMISIAEFIGIKKKDPHYTLLARRWTRGFTITVAVGVVTGTAIGLQLSLLWPSFMQLAGKVIALPLFMETFAFFFEAIFLGIYLYTWDRFKNPMYHWLLSIPVVIGSTLSAFFITSVNGFLNTPQGFELEGDTVTSIQPLAAMFNPATPTKVFHVVSTSYLTAAAVLATIAAIYLLKKKNTLYHMKALKVTVVSVFIFAIATAIAGDLSAKFLAKEQPEKLAAGEWHFETEEGADLVVFGTLNENQEVENAIRIPNGLSFLAYGDFNAEVTGLDQIPDDEEPPLWIHYMFDLMVTIGFFTLGVSLMYLVFWKVKKWNEYHPLLLWGIASLGPLSMAAVEFGWVFAELGRQPWILRGFMTVSEGATTSPYVGWMLILFIGLYIVLSIGCVIALRKIFKGNPAEHELEHRYPEVAATKEGN
ncbi:cytochrome ubiquinol oxidase subunit I [Halobacillus halophilus]|uniref:Cytochrome d ubiquinol oxidase subunit I n=1 Tax=Halobacillus halophilus (strain ATCC 35676 / DSM 2266 / JCM 20832 / KCTC 3685 / LMG 17431 / NBRC 102448 / NCIMB 2269) TaxID=866895 RepID=I0JLX7_HALH3|nr:cytochrome ubiquinol oxidase subunit I [Halobacillus halophilus]ASF39246.1 cytochrome ubiquinol oxidase subunit I [Halobacillus halophilus]CCG45147.1 cytochrome d ubiquinol oxidase subunit I [Halobacillus halophilus DSM 2266]